ncbi:MAG: amphi-Trp domain-containing protein [Vulcanimicrobiota bacterium]
MLDRDVEKVLDREQFIQTLRRIADSLERGESFRIQVLNERLTVPADAEVSIEHEREGDTQELELQFRWALD